MEPLIYIPYQKRQSKHDITWLQAYYYYNGYRQLFDLPFIYEPVIPFQNNLPAKIEFTVTGNYSNQEIILKIDKPEYMSFGVVVSASCYQSRGMYANHRINAIYHQFYTEPMNVNLWDSWRQFYKVRHETGRRLFIYVQLFDFPNGNRTWKNYVYLDM
jgi:hypothetical protein